MTEETKPGTETLGLELGTTIEVKADDTLGSLGLEHPFVDRYGRLWAMMRPPDADRPTLRLVYDPNLTPH